jgi:hypothetical protein
MTWSKKFFRKGRMDGTTWEVLQAAGLFVTKYYYPTECVKKALKSAPQLIKEKLTQ